MPFLKYHEIHLLASSAPVYLGKPSKHDAGQVSSSHCISTGFPQGSVLCPSPFVPHAGFCHYYYSLLKVNPPFHHLFVAGNVSGIQQLIDGRVLFKHKQRNQMRICF